MRSISGPTTELVDCWLLFKWHWLGEFAFGVGMAGILGSLTGGVKGESTPVALPCDDERPVGEMGGMGRLFGVLAWLDALLWLCCALEVVEGLTPLFAN